MRRQLKVAGWSAAGMALGAYLRAPEPVTRFLLWCCLSVPAPARVEQARVRIGGLMVENAPAAARALASKPRSAAATRRLAAFLAAGDCAGLAVDLLRSLLRTDPDDVVTLASLGEAIRLWCQGLPGTPSRPRDARERHDALAEARRALERARELSPQQSRLRGALADVTFAQGDFRDALALIEDLHATSPSAGTAYRLGAARERAEIDDFEGADTAYAEALSRDPSHRKALSRLTSVSIRTGSWNGWEALVRAPGGGVPHSLRPLLREFEHFFRGRGARRGAAVMTADLLGEHARGVQLPPGILHIISARLQGVGEFALGFEVRRALAAQLAAAPGNHVPYVNAFRRWAGAETALGNAAAVSERFSPFPWPPASAASRSALSAIRADAHLVLGDAQALVSLAQTSADAAPLAGEDRMIELVRGKRVAIVGPGLASGEYGEEIDGFDTVIRPRFSREFVRANRRTSGTRTDIAYYSGTDVHVLQSEAAEGIETGELAMVVARPSSYAALSQIALDATWLRFYRRDFSLIMNGGPLGITRILYDILQFAPREVSLYNADYYTGESTFAAGYRSGRDNTATAGSIMMDLFRAHDLATDFGIHHALFLSGRLTGPAEVARILSLSPQQYVAALETAWRARPRDR